MRLAARRQRSGGGPPPPPWPTDRRIVLHVGCGHRGSNPLPPRLAGDAWHEVRLDIDPDVDPDIIGTILDMATVDQRSVDAVWSSHNLEHVSQHEVPVALREFYRVLKAGGIAHVQVPDISVPARQIVRGRLEDVMYTSTAGPVTALDMIFGYGPEIAAGRQYMAHRTGFTARTLGAKFSAVGFEDVRVDVRDHALWATGRRPS